ncbi:MAG: hypothetical protein KDA65_14160 [Planctomycetaceae bacterium]|nr:hypothetical protein [Planctomycetaceae bacterium]
MKRFTAFVAGLLFGAVGMYFAFTLIVVSSPEGTFVIQKSAPSLVDFGYVDVSSWDAEEWGKHLELQRDLVATGHGDLILNPAPVQLIEDVFKTLQQGSKN